MHVVKQQPRLPVRQRVIYKTARIGSWGLLCKYVKYNDHKITDVVHLG